MADTDSTSIKNVNIGTLNVRGLKCELKLKHLAHDMQKYELDILTIQETKLKGLGIIDIGNEYELFHSSSDNNCYYGCGIICKKDLKVAYKPVSDRICMATIRLDTRKLVVIAAYAPTLESSEKDPSKRETFYNTLQGVISTVPKRDLLVIAGDFNAKTGTGHKDHPESIGLYGKGEINENGKFLAEFEDINKFILANTTFKHKMAHRTTWEAPFGNHKGPKCNPRRTNIEIK
jgi:exonuclease III